MIADISHFKKIVESATEGNLTTASEAEQIAALKKNPSLLELIENPSERVQLIALKTYIKSIKYSDPWWRDEYKKFIEILNDPSERIQMLMVSGDACMALEVLNEKGIAPSERVKIAAVKDDGFAVALIEDPSEKVQLLAIEHDPATFEAINNPTEKVQLAAIQLDCANTVSTMSTDGIELTPRVQLAAVQRDVIVLSYYPEQFDLPILLAMPEFKKAVLSGMMTEAREGLPKNVMKLYQYLMDNNINWPELKIIEKYLRDKNIL